MTRKALLATAALLIALGVLPAWRMLQAKPKMCTYQTWEWDAKTRQSINHRKIQKPYSDISTDEKDPRSSCTLCEEDQTWIEVKGLPRLQVCRYFAPEIKKTLTEIKKSGFPVESLGGYRVGKSKGELSSKGLRTKLSLHSYGTAVDINAEYNGLYANCKQFNSSCKLQRGGVWNPKNPKSITKKSAVYKAFARMHWGWAGELRGQQKDFMHFSINGE